MMSECMAPVLEPPAAWVDTWRAEGNDEGPPAALSVDALASSCDYARFAVEQQGVYCQLV